MEKLNDELRAMQKAPVIQFPGMTLPADVLCAFTILALLLFLSSCSDVDRANPAWINWEAELSSSSSSEGTLENPSSSVDELSSVGQSSSSLGTLPSSSGNSSSMAPVASSSSIAIIYGANLIDIRDNASYPTVVIGSQTWMAKNLNYKPVSGNAWCYNNDSISNCANYGRLYDWNAAMTACPTGWRLPSDSDWVALEGEVGGVSVAGTKLKANNALWVTNNGKDAHGFSALPGGVFEQVVNNFANIRSMGYWWTATPDNLVVFARTMNSASAGLGRASYSGAWGLSVRCVKGAGSSSVVSSSSSFAPSSSSVVASSSSLAQSSSSVAGTSSSIVGSSSSSSATCINIDGVNTVTDCRDGLMYKTAAIGGKTWMAENLNYSSTGTFARCFNDSLENCQKYGRLYDYSTAMTACPTGWHLPSDGVLVALEDSVGGTATAGTKLKAISGWNSSGNGTDDYGFSALPGGYYNGSSFVALGSNGVWWTSTADGSANALYLDMDFSSANTYHFSYTQAGGHSVRCWKY